MANEMSREEVVRWLRLMAQFKRKVSEHEFDGSASRDADILYTAVALLQQEQEKQNKVSIPLDTAMVAMDALAMVEIDYSKAGRRARRKSDTTSAIMAEEMLEKVRTNREILRKALGKQ